MFRTLRDRPLALALLLALGALLLFGWQLGRPATLVFDEVHYVPAARTLIDLARPVNTEHPLLGKELIALGMLVFGDNPVGWRAATVVAGAAVVAGVFAILWLLFGRARVAVLGAALAALNGSVFVQARTAMLDGFLGALVVWGIAAMLWAMRSPPRRMGRRLALAGMLLGAAVAVKWVAALYVAFAIGALLLWRSPVRWGGIGAIRGALIVGVASLLTYFLTFAPAFFYAEQPMTLAGLLPFQLDMFERQTQVLGRHPYQSDWWSWPLMLRPIWYFYEYEGGAQRGVLLLGNPTVMWGGLVAVLVCLAAGFRERSAGLAGIGLLWVGSVLVWAAIPKSLGFYYYYHLSGIFLCLAIPAALTRARGRLARADEWVAVATLACFLHFYPIWSGAPLSGPQAFNRWMWFDSWR